MGVLQSIGRQLEETKVKHQELKRLQKEIDEANEWISNQQPDSEWSLLWQTNYDLITERQAKIKQIIESL